MNDRNKIPIIMTIVVIFLIMVIGFTSQQRERLTPFEKWVGDLFMPFQRVVSQGYHGIESQIRTLLRSGEMKEENRKLKEELHQHQLELIDIQLKREEIAELKNLQNTLNSIDRSSFSKNITANVIGNNSGNWFQMFTVDAGESKGVEVNSVVLGSGGLIGRVYETGNSWSKVISIIDNSSSVSFQVLRDGNLQGIVSGSVDNELRGYLFDPDADIVVGDKLITSGIGLYPKGILIGDITDISTSTDQLLQNIEVKPAVNFNRMNKVTIINPRISEE